MGLKLAISTKKQGYEIATNGIPNVSKEVSKKKMLLTLTTINQTSMKSTLKTWKTGRNLLLNIFDQYSLEQLNTIPAGFNNNLIWNIGHVIVAQQGLVYKSSGLKGHISDELYATYKPGTKPDGLTSQEEMNTLKKLTLDLVNQTEKDLENGVFKEYKERQTATGFHLGNLEDALEFNNYHEGLHMGYMMAIRKFL